MRLIRPSSLEEYATWYLARDAAKSDHTLGIARSTEAVRTMRERHEGKMRAWFDGSERWSLALLDDISDLERLVFLESTWTVRAHLVVPGRAMNYRLLGKVARNALSSRYLSLPNASGHLAYYRALDSGQLRLTGDSKIALCSPETSERSLNPLGSFYLLDGVGRCLPLMMLLYENRIKFEPVEALLAERLSVDAA